MIDLRTETTEIGDKKVFYLDRYNLRFSISARENIAHTHSMFRDPTEDIS